MQLRTYQQEIAFTACEKLKKLGFVYISAEVRTGKTLMALETARLYGAKKVLFITKKKAVDSIKKDYESFNYSAFFELEVINTESMHKHKIVPDLVINDEAHKFGAFPKPSGGQKKFKAFFSHLPVICLSGTPCPESYSQLFHQFSLTDFSPFSKYVNFYKWANDYVIKRTKKLPHGTINDYSNAKKDEILEVLNDYFITYTQKEAGFSTEINEEVLLVDMPLHIKKIIERLHRDKVVQGKTDVILADTPVKLMQKTHQLSSGTIIFEGGKSSVLSDFKARFIQEYFEGKKIALFYKFKAELESIKSVLDVTESLDDFNSSNKSIALQIASGREGVNLSKAESLVFFNIDFSAVSYWQARDRLSTKDRAVNNVFWVFSRGGIEEEIYEAVAQKKDYTLSIFNRKWKNRNCSEK